MKRLLISLALITVFIFGVNAQSTTALKSNRYDVSETVNPTDTLMRLKADMKPLDGVVYCEFGDIGKYVNGKEDGVCKGWYENGQLESEYNYKDGKKEGVQKSWYKNGQLEFEENIKEGVFLGVNRRWYENGQLRYESNDIEGVFKEWFDNGKLKREENYKDDKRINRYPSPTIKFGNLEVMTEYLGRMDED